MIIEMQNEHEDDYREMVRTRGKERRTRVFSRVFKFGEDTAQEKTSKHSYLFNFSENLKLKNCLRYPNAIVD